VAQSLSDNDKIKDIICKILPDSDVAQIIEHLKELIIDGTQKNQLIKGINKLKEESNDDLIVDKCKDILFWINDEKILVIPLMKDGQKQSDRVTVEAEIENP
jgi:hypothetical protein